MISHDDRILHHALRKLLSDEEAVDLAPAVVEAWERGATGSYDAEDEEHRREATADRARRLWPRLAAAAALLAAGAGVAYLTVGGERALTPEPLPYALASRPLERLAAEPASTTALAIGDRLRVPRDAGEAVEVRFASGGFLRAAPGTVFAVDERQGEVEVRLELGALRVRRGGGPALVVDTGFARLAPDPWADLALTARPDDAAWTGAGAPSAVDAVARGDALHRALLVEVLAGTARVAHRDEERTVVQDDAFALRDDPDYAASVAVADAEWMLDLCRRAAPAEELPMGKMPAAAVAGTDLAETDADRAAAELSAHLDEHPEHWCLLHPKLLALMAEEPDWYVRDLLRVVVRHDSPGARRLARALWRDEPARFEEDHVIALAEQGAFDFAREVRALVDGYAFGDELVPVRCAAYLAGLGDRRGVPLLRDAASVVPVDQRSMNDLFVAVLALDHLGLGDAWPQTRKAMAVEGLYALERGDEPAARSIAMTLDLAEARRAAGAPLPVAFLEDHVARHQAGRKDEVTSTDDLRRLLEELAQD